MSNQDRLAEIAARIDPPTLEFLLWDDVVWLIAEVERLRAALAHIVKCDQLSNLWSRSVAIEALRASVGTPQAEEPTP